MFGLFGGAKPQVQKISHEEAKRIMQEEKDVLVVDVRTPGECRDGHIPGAINIPNETIAKKEPAQLPDKQQKILVYCASGARSKIACGKLMLLGYENVLNFGGINGWTGPVER